MRWTEFAAKEARHTLAAWERRVGSLQPPIAVEDLADLLYLLAIDLTDALPPTLAGRLFADHQIIEVRRNDHPRRQRFTIAHEIGHYRLHIVAEGVQRPSYACAQTMIGEGAELEQLASLHEPPLPGFAVPVTMLAQPSEQTLRRHELEANSFAAELLMPAQLVEQAVERYGKDVPALAELFDVSRQAMQYRLEKLLILPRSGPQLSFLDDL
jgi:DNA helicase II / ATP-dependent DNA helicase PcrA